MTKNFAELFAPGPAMKIRFWKMHGAGNDFILADDRDEQFPLTDSTWLQRLARRKTGVGCEGFILIQNSRAADFRMRFLNPDGSEVEMCGNGARCVARLAHELGIAPPAMTFETIAGIISAEVLTGQVRLHMTDPTHWRLGATLELFGRQITYGFVNSGVPHVVIEVDNLENFNVHQWGAAIRHHRNFAPAGANANFVCVTSPDSLTVRTYERGVEAETLACGTGIVASALICAKTGKLTPPVTVSCQSNDLLEVNFTLTPESARAVTLLGPVVHVYTAELLYP